MASRTEAAQIHKGHLMVLPDPALPASAKQHALQGSACLKALPEVLLGSILQHREGLWLEA